MANLDEKVSIVIPVYNVEKYIVKCVSSVMNQTYSNIEIILVDDGSTDKSGEICDVLATKDSRIKVYHKKNGGPSDARNYGIDRVHSKYITFIDSDDYVTKDYVKYLLGLLKKTKSDIASCSYKRIYSSADCLNKQKEHIEVMKSSKAIEMYLYKKTFTASAHCKIYKSELFSNIRYPVGYIYEDMAVICELLAAANSIAVSNQQKYYYRQRENSIMRGAFHSGKMQRIEVAETVRSFIQQQYPEILSAAEARCFLAAVQTLREVQIVPDNQQYLSVIREEIRLYRKTVWKDKKAPMFLRGIAFCSMFGMKTLKQFGNIYTRVIK